MYIAPLVCHMYILTWTLHSCTVMDTHSNAYQCYPHIRQDTLHKEHVCPMMIKNKYGCQMHRTYTYLLLSWQLTVLLVILVYAFNVDVICSGTYIWNLGGIFVQVHRSEM